MLENPMVLSQNIELEPWSRHRLDDFHRLLSDPRVFWWGASKSKEESLTILNGLIERVQKAPRGCGAFAIIDPQGRCVGNAALIPSKPIPGAIEVAYEVEVAFQGKGYATQAASRLIATAFTTMKLDEVVALIVPHNRPSQRVAEKLGFSVQGTVVHANLLHQIWVQKRPRP